MKDLFKNPHPFDMNDYYSGLTYVIGGRDFEKEEKFPLPSEKQDPNRKTIKQELDWSFLKSRKHPKVK